MTLRPRTELLHWLLPSQSSAGGARASTQRRVKLRRQAGGELAGNGPGRSGAELFARQLAADPAPVLCRPMVSLDRSIATALDSFAIDDSQRPCVARCCQTSCRALYSGRLACAYLSCRT